MRNLKLPRIGPNALMRFPFKLLYLGPALCLSELEHAIKVIADVLIVCIGEPKCSSLEQCDITWVPCIVFYNAFALLLAFASLPVLLY
jgi:hypothetical protein